MIKQLYFTACFLFCVSNIIAGNNTAIFNSNTSLLRIGKQIEILEDVNNQFNDNTILVAKGFYKSNKEIPVFSSPNINAWLRFSLSNQTPENNLYLYIDYFNLSYITIYKEVNGKLIKIYFNGNAVKRSEDSSPGYLLNLRLSSNTSASYYIHIESFHPVIFDSYIGNYQLILGQTEKGLFTVSVYFGVLLVIFLYNLFLFFATADKNYLLYILYIFFLGLAQFSLAGYSFKFFWPSHPFINYWAVPVASAATTLCAVLFSVQFLRTKYYTPLLHKLLLATIFINIISIIASFLKINSISYAIIGINFPAVGILAISAAISIIFKGYRPALYYAISWILLLSGLIIFTLRNYNVLPANSFTNYILYLGSAIEAVLLSIALADRINILKKEKEESQAEALKQARENEKLVNEQNILLEEKVTLRTKELQVANNQLSETLTNLKDTQTQLVDAEKMASLGQLTAGIAHEINNPINFVKSNITPLRLDVKDLLEVLNAYDELHSFNENHNGYKQKLNAIAELKEDIDIAYVQKEISSLIAGIEEGAERTAEIVKGLRTFSRIDEAALKTVNVHEGILSTIVLLKNNIPYYVKLVKDFQAEGNIECFPGKLNQVFMNILTNAIQAITAKPEKTDEEEVTIKTRDIDNNHIEVSIKDSGMGMTEDVKHRIFEPFFTTKEVGEGTGLGMAIVFKIIQKHNGKINIISAPGEGSEFVITLPHRYEGLD